MKGADSGADRRAVGKKPGEDIHLLGEVDRRKGPLNIRDEAIRIHEFSGTCIEVFLNASGKFLARYQGRRSVCSEGGRGRRDVMECPAIDEHGGFDIWG
jgi:hypothetical protein